MADSIGIMLAILALVGWGTYTVFLKKIVNKLGEYTCLLFNHFIAVILLGVIAVFTTRLKMPSDFVIVAVLVGSILGAATVYLFYKAINAGSVGVVSVIASLHALWTAIAAMFLFGEQLNADKYLAIGLILVGAALAAIERFKIPKEFDEHHLSEFAREAFSKGAGLAVVVSVCWTIYNIAVKYTTIELGPHRTAAYFETLVLVFILFAFLTKPAKDLVTWPKKDQWKPLLVSSMLFALGAIGFYFALVYLPVSTLLPIVSAAPAVTVIGAAVVLKERVRVHQYIGIALAVVGIVILAM
jgi:drug/metabolite transporter (DMT)-like permease